jgi:hypothetical protein
VLVQDGSRIYSWQHAVDVQTHAACSRQFSNFAAAVSIIQHVHMHGIAWWLGSTCKQDVLMHMQFAAGGHCQEGSRENCAKPIAGATVEAIQAN